MNQVEGGIVSRGIVLRSDVASQNTGGYISCCARHCLTLKRPEVDLTPAVVNRCAPFLPGCAERDAYITFIARSVPEILLLRHDPKVIAAVVQSIPVNVVNHHVGRRRHNSAVQEYRSPTLVSAYIPVRALSGDIPAMGTEERQVAIVNCDDRFICGKIYLHGRRLEHSENKVQRRLPRFSTNSGAEFRLRSPKHAG